MRDRGVIPADLLAKLPDVTGAVFPTVAQLDAARRSSPRIGMRLSARTFKPLRK
jgi:hypothetical protein